MVTIPSGQRFTTIHWYAAPLVLSTAYAWKPYVRTIRKFSGTGAVSNNGGTGIQSYTTIQTGDLVVLDAKNIPTGGFQVDNGTPPSGGTVTPPKEFYLDGTTVVAGETTYDASDKEISFDEACTLTAAFSQGTGTVQYSTNSLGSTPTWTTLNATPVALPANTAFVLRVQHSAGASFYATVTATFS